MSDTFYTSIKAARLLEITQVRVLQLIKRGSLPASKIPQGNRQVWRIREHDLRTLKPILDARKPKVYTEPIVEHLCHCGCGMETPIAPRTCARRRLIKGQPCKFIQGHNDRARSKVRYIIDAQTGCWIWQRYVLSSGYGVTSAKGKKGKTALAHRVFYIEKYGEIPTDKELDHVCRNTSCVNPDHLEPVTHLENMRRYYATKKKAA